MSDFNSKTKERIAERRRTMRKKNVRDSMFMRHMAEAKENRELHANCPFIINSYYEITHNKNLKGKYRFVGIDFNHKRYIWSISEANHDLKFSSIAIKGTEISYSEFIKYWFVLDNESTLSEV
jgi:hypothetical protein